MQGLYTIGLYIYFSLFRLAAFFHPKAAAWWELRRNWSGQLDLLDPGKKTIWIHVASAGEFEQAIPLIRRIRGSGLPLQVAVSSFSNSGYQACIRSGLADACFPFPPDFSHNVNLIIRKVDPAITFFIRNEIWLNTLKQLKDQLSPAILINAEREPRSGIYGLYLEAAYPLFSQICYVNETGSTKAERVLEIAAEPFPDPVLETYSGDGLIVMLGSCYDREVKQFAKILPDLRKKHPGLKLVLCPHEWDEHTHSRYEAIFGKTVARYSSGQSAGDLLFVDRMGILKYLYRYADIAYVGGGFGKGVHNVSEAAVYGIPVMTGPKHQRFPELGPLIGSGQVKITEDLDELEPALEHLLENPVTETQKENWKTRFTASGNASEKIWEITETYLNR